MDIIKCGACSCRLVTITVQYRYSIYTYYSLQHEISGFERLCLAKDKLLIEKEVEQLQLEETIRQQILEELQALGKV